MASTDGERYSLLRHHAQERARQSSRTSEEANFKTSLATPLVVALVALGLLVVGVILGAAGAQLAYGSSSQAHVHHRETAWRSLDAIAHRRIRANPGHSLGLNPFEDNVAATRQKVAQTRQVPHVAGARHHDHAGKEGHTRSQLSHQENMESLESIMYHYRSDKSKDDKKYSDLFAMLFDPIRLKVRNVTEVGMGDGGSTVGWHDYFRKAQIFGIDKSLSRVRNYLSGLPRVHTIEANPAEVHIGALGLLPNSMDVVFESAGQGMKGQQQILLRMWQLVRPGGYYIIEDVGWDRDGDDHRAYPLIHQPYKLSMDVRKILQENDAFFADTTLGHRDWEDYIKEVPEDLNHFSHNAHVIVIKKRTEPLRAVTINTRNFIDAPAETQTYEPLYQRRQAARLGLS